MKSYPPPRFEIVFFQFFKSWKKIIQNLSVPFLIFSPKRVPYLVCYHFFTYKIQMISLRIS